MAPLGAVSVKVAEPPLTTLDSPTMRTYCSPTIRASCAGTKQSPCASTWPDVTRSPVSTWSMTKASPGGSPTLAIQLLPPVPAVGRMRTATGAVARSTVMSTVVGCIERTSKGQGSPNTAPPSINSIVYDSPTKRAPVPLSCVCMYAAAAPPPAAAAAAAAARRE